MFAPHHPLFEPALVLPAFFPQEGLSLTQALTTPMVRGFTAKLWSGRRVIFESDIGYEITLTPNRILKNQAETHGCLLVEGRLTPWVPSGCPVARNYIAIFPTVEDVDLYHRSSQWSLEMGPAAICPGAVGVMEISPVPDTNTGGRYLQITFIQSTVNISELARHDPHLEKTFRTESRVYGGWMERLIYAALDEVIFRGWDGVQYSPGGRQPQLSAFERVFAKLGISRDTSWPQEVCLTIPDRIRSAPPWIVRNEREESPCYSQVMRWF